jgi:hypothetical protein
LAEPHAITEQKGPPLQGEIETAPEPIDDDFDEGRE